MSLEGSAATHASRTRPAIGLLVTAFAACAACTHPTARPIDFDLLRDVAVHGIYGEPVTLDNGRYEGPPYVAGGASRPLLVLRDDVLISGRVHGMGNGVTAVLLTETSGGSATFVYLAAFRSEGGRVHNVGTALVGDRVRVRKAAIVGGGIVLDVVEAAADEPRCCGTQLVRKRYESEDRTLRLISSAVVPTVSAVRLGLR